MVQKVTVPNVGVVEFSDSMSPDDITAAIKIMLGGAAPALFRYGGAVFP